MPIAITTSNAAWGACLPLVARSHWGRYRSRASEYSCRDDVYTTEKKVASKPMKAPPLMSLVSQFSRPNAYGLVSAAYKGSSAPRICSVPPPAGARAMTLKPPSSSVNTATARAFGIDLPGSAVSSAARAAYSTPPSRHSA